MAKVYYIDPIDHLSGKVCRHTQTIFMHRSDTGKNFTTRICHPYRGELSDGVRQANENFKATVANVNEIMRDSQQMQSNIEPFKKQTRYTTLRGFIFAQEYNNL